MAVRGAKIGAALLAATVVVGLAGCAGEDTPTVATVTSTVTAGQPAPNSSSPTKPRGTGTKDAPASTRKLQASFTKVITSQPVGIAIVPVGGGTPILLGDQTPQVAWSTIKVPLALAAERANGASGSESVAIVDSDNGSAEALWASLGGGVPASRAVTAVLREGGDPTSVVPSEKLRPEFTVFGQTTWALADAAAFTANLPCLPGSRNVVSLMGRVSGNQQWGLESIRGKATAVKGGWGPSLSGGYVVRQIGLVTKRDGSRVAVAMTTYGAGTTMESGIAALEQVGRWVGAHLGALPSGRCS